MKAKEIYEEISQKDVQAAAHEFRPLYERTASGDGYVSLEVNPHLAHDTKGTIEEARRLWTAVNRPNIMIKVPGTAEGLPAIKQLISEGINVNVTLLFGLPRYRQVAEAYIAGIEERLAMGKPVNKVASVASFFLSRIDKLVDPMLEKTIAEGKNVAGLAGQAHGEIAVSSAKMAYQIYTDLFKTPKFQSLAVKGARPQRVLWASTGTKNPAYSDIKYIEALIGPETINTIPVETLNAYRDHGDPKARLADGMDQASVILERMPGLGINMDVVTQQLEDEAVKKFIEPFDKLMDSIAQKMSRHSPGKP
jgi:transaldolase